MPNNQEPPQEPPKLICFSGGKKQEEVGQQCSQPEWGQKATTNLSEAIELFRQEIASYGLGSPNIEPDGEIHRFGTDNDKQGKKSGWYVFFPDGIPGGAYGAWNEDISRAWRSKPMYEMSSEEIARQDARFEAIQKAKKAKRQQEADAAAVRAWNLWTSSSQSSAQTLDHPYLHAKGVQAYGLRISGLENSLLVPMQNGSAEFRGVQTISPGGDKRYLKGIAMDGVYHLIEGDMKIIYLCEGYATGASVHEATRMTVAVCFDSGNLPKAAQVIKEVYPNSRLIVAADDDRWKKVNAGVEAARKAAALTGAEIRLPKFKSSEGKPTDFNDLHAREGLDAVRSQVRSYSVSIKDWSLQRLSGKQVPEREWLVDQTIPLGTAMILAAPGGTGKGILTLDMAIKVASEPIKQNDQLSFSSQSQVLGHDVVAHGPVVMLAAEDDQDEVHRRAATLCGDEFPENLYPLCMPDMDGVFSILAQGKYGELERTGFWHDIEEQILTMKPRLLVVDPLSCFVFADLNDRNVGATVMSMFTCLARKANMAVVVVHHLNKLKDNVKDLDAARNAISGSAGFVDHGRGAYVFWPEEESKAKELCKSMEIEFQRHRVIRGGLAKNNFPGDTEEKVYVRQDNGLLVTVDMATEYAARVAHAQLLDLLEKVIGHAANQDKPFQHQGKHGLFEKRERLPERLRVLSKHKIESLGRQLLDSRRIDKYRPLNGGNAEIWLDVPGGNFAMGSGNLDIGEFKVYKEEK